MAVKKPSKSKRINKTYASGQYHLTCFACFVWGKNNCPSHLPPNFGAGNHTGKGGNLTCIGKARCSTFSPGAICSNLPQSLFSIGTLFVLSSCQPHSCFTFYRPRACACGDSRLGTALRSLLSRRCVHCNRSHCSVKIVESCCVALSCCKSQYDRSSCSSSAAGPLLLFWVVVIFLDSSWAGRSCDLLAPALILSFALSLLLFPSRLNLFLDVLFLSHFLFSSPFFRSSMTSFWSI